MTSKDTKALKFDITTLKLSDGYKSNYRLWGPPSGKDVIIMLHGGMSHSAWQAPLAEAIRFISDVSFVATDRRGCGLNNEERGDLKSPEIMIDDVIKYVAFFKKSFDNIHLAGWCQGCQFAVPGAYQIREQKLISSLILMTPGFFWSERFTSIQEIARKYLLTFLSEFNIEPEPKKPFIPVPMIGTDFTSIKKWLDYIENDDLKTTHISLNTVSIMDFMQKRSADEILDIDIPLLLIVAEKDRIVDSKKVKDHLNEVLGKCKQSRMVSYNTEHAVHFEKAQELAKEILKFISNI